MSVLPLIKEEAIYSTNNLDPEEIVQRTQVLNGKLSMKTISELLKKSSQACCQDDVVDVKQQEDDIIALVVDKQ